MTENDQPDCPNCGHRLRKYRGHWSCNNCSYHDAKSNTMTNTDHSDQTTYDQRPCPKCGHREGHLPLEYTEAMVCDCSECGYTFVKRPTSMPDNTLNAVPIEVLEQLRDEVDNAAMQSLEREESAYDAYERCAGRIQHIIDTYTDN